MLGAIESLMSAVVSDRMSGDKHNPNVELVAQGIANVVSPLFGGLPATGAIARTATNIRSGARTPVAGMHPCADAARHRGICSAFSSVHTSCRTGCDTFGGLYNMGEWREIPSFETSSPGNRDLADHLSADRLC